MMCGVTSTMCSPQRVRKLFLVSVGFVDEKRHLSVSAYILGSIPCPPLIYQWSNKGENAAGCNVTLQPICDEMSDI